jgi:Rrf2 family protein
MSRHDWDVRVSAKVDYAVRAAVELAAAQRGAEPSRPVKAEALSRAQDIPLKFLENILQGLRQAGLVESRRGPDGGHLLARPAAQIALADIIRAIDGPLAGVGGRRPEDLAFTGAAEPLRDVWIAVRASLRRVLEEVTVADVAAGSLPALVAELTTDPGAWAKR